MVDLISILKKNPFVLAPMAGITDSCFRQFMKKMGAGVVVSELISAHGIQYKGKKTLDILKYDESERPVGIQLFGENPTITAEAARYVESIGADFVDLNFGCPVPKVVKKGAGSAMLRDPLAFAEMIRTVKQSISIPLTIKIRTGWDEKSRNASQLINIAKEEGVTWIAIHGRTRAQGYSGKSDWDYIREVKAQTDAIIIGNGDIVSGAQANARLRESRCDGVMIGRGCLKNPWIFEDAVGLLINPSQSPRKRWGGELRSTIQVLSDLLASSCDARVYHIQLRKFAAWFSSGYPGASLFRKKIFQTNSVEELKIIIDDYFSELGELPTYDIQDESFLMGGHG